MGPASHTREFENDAKTFNDLEDCYYEDDRPQSERTKVL